MHIEIYGIPRFALPLSTDDVALLMKLSARHYDGTCRQASQDGAFPGQFGLLCRWKRMLDSYVAENEPPQPVTGEFRELDLCLKIMEDPGPFAPEEAERLSTLRLAFGGALRLANEVRPSWKAQYDSAPAPMPEPDPARALYEALGKTFSLLECRKALMRHPDPVAAANWLTDGHWQAGRLVSWDHASLADKTRTLAAETGHSVHHCLTVLQNCVGSLELARRKLAGLPVLDQPG
jgi:hypothetical protein